MTIDQVEGTHSIKLCTIELVSSIYRTAQDVAWIVTF